MPGKGSRDGAEMRRAAAVLLLVAVAAVGLRAGGAFSAAGSSEILGTAGHTLYWLIAATEAVMAVAGVALLIARLIWGRGRGAARQRKRWPLWWVLLLPIAALGLAKIIARLRRRAAGSAPVASGHGQAGHAAGAAHPHPGSPVPLLVTFAVVALLAAALTVYRRRRAAPPAPDASDTPETSSLEEALAAGAQALEEDPDPRTAIIGCYAAMERSLADAGAPPRLADTPAEVLGRATTGGLVRSAWAGTLTGLFRQARYSGHPMTEADRAAARGALAGVRADLGGGP